MSRVVVFLTLGTAILGAGAGVVLWSLSLSTLYDVSMATGWILALVLVAGTLPLLVPRLRKESPAGSSSPDTRPLLLAAMTTAYLAHNGFGLPPGWIERTMLVLFAALAGTTLLERAMEKRSPAPPPETFVRCLLARTVLAAALMTVGLFHGVFVHAHGLLAHLFLED